MDARFEAARLSPEAMQARSAAQADCSIEPLNDKDALYVLNAMRSNDFENALNAVEHFLGHLEVTDSDPTFATAATWLDDAMEQFAALDCDKDGRISRDELYRLQQANEQDWLTCHFDALTRARLLPDSGNELTLRGLQTARDVFRGLSIVQKHLAQFVERGIRERAVITPASVDRFLAMHISELATPDYLALLELANYLKGLHREFCLGANCQCGQVEQLSPEELWPAKISS
jgi:hypothetical protein